MPMIPHLPMKPWTSKETMDVDLPTRRRRPSKQSATHENDSSLQPRKRRLKRHAEEQPFWVLVLQVGATIFVVCAFLATLARWVLPEANDDDYADDKYVTEEEKIPTEPTLPEWTLGDAARFDAYGIAEMHAKEEEEDDFWKVSATLRREFSERYGGETVARAILERGISAFGDAHHTACRIRDAKEQGRPFKFAFGGYSVTVGRGNLFSQSFPLVMERILKRPFGVLGVDLQVRNAAIGGIPSFPYGWCMANFWGLDADVVSWDYSMNEAGGVPQGLEAYIRHTVSLDRAPKLIIKDTHMAQARRDLLKTYTDNGVLKDAVVIHTDPAATPFLAVSEEQRPYGFREWRKFGSPNGAPGQALHHPAVKEHEFIAWILAMHFLSALELVAADRASSLLQCTLYAKVNLLPPPVSVNPVNHTMDWFSILFGDLVKNTSDWTLNPVHCRTSFEPIVRGSLESLIVSGTSGDGIDIMLPKGAMYYSKGWVLDLSDDEKLAKRKLDRYNGLGYVDSKKAYYGIYASGPLRLFLPFEGQSRVRPKTGDAAVDWFRSVVVCEVNEKRDYGSCNAEKHVSYTIGGVNATDAKMISSPGALYFGKRLCLYTKVPNGAKLTSSNVPKGTAVIRNATETVVGLSVDITIKDMHIMKKNLACSVSHVVWEQTFPKLET